MKALIKALLGQRVEIQFSPDAVVSHGIIQSVRGDTATIDDCYGGAWGLTISEIKGLRVDHGQPALILIA